MENIIKTDWDDISWEFIFIDFIYFNVFHKFTSHFVLVT